jgi:predicted Rossmann-fold nucleotide-binding protein
MKMQKLESAPLFYEKNSKENEQNEKARFLVSVLGGEGSEKNAEELGYGLTKNWHSVKTGGYSFGTMKAALEGADKALKEMSLEISAAQKNAVSVPQPTGIVAEGIMSDKVVQGEFIKAEAIEGEYGLYLRLAKLIEDSNVNIILPGTAGTELEVMANIAFDKKLKKGTTLKQSPVIFVGDSFKDLLLTKFKAVVDGSKNIFMVEDVNEANELTEKIFRIDYLKDNPEEEDSKTEIVKLEKDVEKKLLKFENN